ncbi:MAG: chemotaxis protein CheC, partial [Defluviitaleaceae bacterium]|nr:chemotaxis protein CheC [Defluviitaleaceae bacterium]
MGDLLSQEEINALLGTGIESDEGDDFVSFDDVVGSDDDNDSDSSLPPSISSDQIDALGEIGNISMGTSATTLHALLGQKVLITTPRVTVIRWEAVAANYDRPCIAIRVNYVEGVQGSNVLLLRERDVKIITSLMMGGTGEIDENEGITELDLSAIGEAMNQMIGSASTSL